jgi:protein-S-isoprenylcysteine O-methyltransferase Ste14
LLVAAYLIFRVLVRRDYRRVGRLGPLTVFLEFLIWGAFVCFPTIYNPSGWWSIWFADTFVGPLLGGIGSALTIFGVAITVVAMGMLGVCRTLGQTGEVLGQRGLYRVSRNPQIVSFGVAVVGIAVLWPSWYALGWMALYVVIAHMMVLTEEEHLRKQFGETYLRYCARVPRYLGLPWAE